MLSSKNNRDGGVNDVIVMAYDVKIEKSILLCLPSRGHPVRQKIV